MANINIPTALILFRFLLAPVILGLALIVGENSKPLILPEWTHDIPSTYHAYLIRKGVDFKRNEYLNG